MFIHHICLCMVLKLHTIIDEKLYVQSHSHLPKIKSQFVAHTVCPNVACVKAMHPCFALCVPKTRENLEVCIILYVFRQRVENDLIFINCQ